MKTFYFLFMFLMITYCSKKQEGTFSYRKPMGWKDISTDSIIKFGKSRYQPILNAKTFSPVKYQNNFNLTKDQLSNQIINIVTRVNIHPCDGDFFDSVKKQLNSYNEIYDTFQFTDGPKMMKIDGMDALYFFFRISRVYK